MCFRPADANAPTSIDCPSCGKKINYTNGVLPKKCPFCKTELSADGVVSAPSAPSPAGAPAPGAPTAPGVPGAPGSMKPPSGGE